MPADRHDDRADAQYEAEQNLTAPRNRHVREQVAHSVAALRARAAGGARGVGSGASIDAEMDRIVSSEANSTPDAPGRTNSGDGLTNDTLRAALESHRREMELAAYSEEDIAARNATRDRAGGIDPNAAPTVDRQVRPEDLPPRQAALRDPRHPESPGRPSVTTMTQKHSYGPQNFARNDVIDRPRSMPAIAAGGGPGTPAPPASPAPATGAAAARNRSRETPERAM